ncbi:hypothetical protein BDZ94DRAFT_917307 [Collybia nuda]|uniref:Uncharacterized protein n=1 Tax=Collybia nuda TaxID=64659 RepID=A0A9P5YFY9_9AGAR|nr:hypothetical protein BDZ94DRAFT_917307 [Collybia nuda]
MKIYVELGTSLFGGLDEKAWDNIIERDGLKTEAFELKLASIVEKHTGDRDALLKIQKTSSDKVDRESTNVFITTVEPAGASSTEPYRLRSYTTPSRGIQPTLGNHAWTVCEAIRAGIASPSFLKPLQIGSQYFQDAGNSGSANPVWDALKEAELRWSKNVQPVIISLGTGVVSLFPVDSDLEEDLSERYYEPVSTRVQVGTKAPKSKLWSDEFAKQLIRVAQDTELKHQGAAKHFNKRSIPQLKPKMIFIDDVLQLGDKPTTTSVSIQTRGLATLICLTLHKFG